MKETDHDLLERVRQVFPIRRLREGQETIIRALLSGRDVFAVMATGSGKSLCYQYAATRLPGVTLVVSPLIALMQDQVAHLRELGIPAACLHSAMSAKERQAIAREVDEGRCRLLYLSPERLITHRFLRFARRQHIALLVVDEAHCVSLWGYDFRPGYLNIPQFVRLLGARPPIAAFTATASARVRQDVREVLALNEPLCMDTGLRRENLRLSVRHFASDGRKRQRLSAYLRRHGEEAGIVYAATVRAVDELYEWLSGRGFSVLRYHGRLSAAERRDSLEAFMSGSKRVMVATNAFGMGVDKEDIRFVIHFHMAKDLESYVQEIGRAGRDGMEADCILYAAPQDEERLRRLLCGPRSGSPREEELEEFRSQLSIRRFAAMAAYAKEGASLDETSLQARLDAYFAGESKEQERQLQETERRIRERLLPAEREIPGLYTNETKLAWQLRKGGYVPGRPERVRIGRRADSPLVHTFRLSGALSYFDLMVADAVYTLYFFGRKKFYIKNILELLSGDPAAVLKPERGAQTQGKVDRRTAFAESLERMAHTDIRIDRHIGPVGSVFADEKEEQVLEGSFLPLVREGKTGYRLTAVPPLYRYAELTDEQFFFLPRAWLAIADSRGVRMPNSIENLKLRHFLARRIRLMRPVDWQDGVRWSRRIRLRQGQRREPALYEILDLPFPQDPYQKKRRRETLEAKIRTILEAYIRDQLCGVSAFAFHGDPDAGPKEGSVSAELFFLPKEK